MKKLSLLFCLFLALTSLEGNELPDIIIGKDGMEMVLVPEGDFVIGPNVEPDEKQRRTIYLPAFYIDRYEVSNAQYAQFVKETGYPPPPHWNGTNPPPGSEDLPVTNITWFDAMRYAIWAGKRLPTEAEWEKAGRGGDGRLFPWGNEDNPKARNLSTDKLAPVDSYKEGVSPYKCYNMTGNVWEWTADWYEAYPGSEVKSPHFGRKYKVVKGGGAFDFYPIPNTGRLDQRARCLPYGFYEGLGFRCVKDVNPNQAPYDPKALLEEAERILKRPQPPPNPLSYEMEFKKFLGDGFLPIKVQGMPGEEGYVRVGVPFPRGFLRDLKNLQISSSAGKIRPPTSKGIKLLG
ncbi:formylglycine-generating enzyme family protein [bacterium]|nr:formylglycine-generating enzyme family protein [bacterium]